MPNSNGGPTFWDKELPQEQRMALAEKAQALAMELIREADPAHMMMVRLLCDHGAREATMQMLGVGAIGSKVARDMVRREQNGEKLPKPSTLLLDMMRDSPGEAGEKLGTAMIESMHAIDCLDRLGRASALYMMAGIYIAHPENFDYLLSDQMMNEEIAIQRRERAKTP
jgi:hypothetical protein